MKAIIKKVNIAGRSYPVETFEDENPILVQTLTRLEKDLRDFQSHFPNNTAQDNLAMTVLTYGLELSKNSSSLAQFDLLPSLEVLNSKLDEIFDSSNSLV